MEPRQAGKPPYEERSVPAIVRPTAYSIDGEDVVLGHDEVLFAVDVTSLPA